MAESSSLSIIYSPTAEEDLWHIWTYNFARYSLEHAEEYQAFLLAGINTLSETHSYGRRIEAHPELRCLTLKRKHRGDGHNIIYEVRRDIHAIHIHHVFHTKMDMDGRLDND